MDAGVCLLAVALWRTTCLAVLRLQSSIRSSICQLLGHVRVQVLQLSIIRLDLLNVAGLVVGIRSHATVLGGVEVGGVECGGVRPFAEAR